MTIIVNKGTPLALCELWSIFSYVILENTVIFEELYVSFKPLTRSVQPWLRSHSHSSFSKQGSAANIQINRSVHVRAHVHTYLTCQFHFLWVQSPCPSISEYLKTLHCSRSMGNNYMGRCTGANRVCSDSYNNCKRIYPAGIDLACILAIAFERYYLSIRSLLPWCCLILAQLSECLLSENVSAVMQH